MNDFSVELQNELDFPLARMPQDPDVGENWGFWLFGEDGSVGVHSHIQREEGFWKHCREYIHVFLGNGRYLRVWGSGGLSTEDGPGGANLKTTCLEPFRRWRYEFSGITYETLSAAAVSGPLSDRSPERASVEIDLTLTMAAPPWVQGTLSQTALAEMRGQGGLSTGGFRYEQLLWVEGTVVVNGDTHKLSGGGLRTHRAGKRNLNGFFGHTWASAIFRNGRGFGFQLLQSAPDGPYSFREGFVLSKGKLLPANVISAPGLKKLIPYGEKFEIILESELGRDVIQGEIIHTALVTIVKGVRQQPAGFYPFGVDASRPDNTAMPQSGARYVWDGATTVNMIERSATISALGAA